MSDYIAPIKDMTFVLNELAGLPALSQIPRFADSTAEMVSTVMDEAAKFASGVIAPLNEIGDNHGARCENNSVQESPGFADAYQKMVEGGWVALPCNPEYGGMGMPEVVGMAAGEMWTAANMSFALCSILGQGAINSIETHASDVLKAIYLEKMVSGEWTGSMNLTEPQAGSDLSVVRTKAEREGDHYRISGTKIFISWGDHQMTENVVHLVLARMPDAPAGVKGISLFIVPKFLVNEDGSIGERNDAYAVSVEHKMGIHGSPTCVMSFGENGGAVGYLVGQENHGLAHMFTMMNHARLNVGMQGLALSDRAYQHAVAYAKDRVQGPAAGDADIGPIIRHPDVRRMLLVMRSLTEASRAVCYVATAAFDFAHHSLDADQRKQANSRGELLTPIAKAWVTEVAQEVASLGMQVHGGMGFVEETGAAQYVRDVRITTIYEGTTGIQANDLIGRKLIRDNGQELQCLLADVAETITALTAAGDGYAVIATELAEAAAAVERMAQQVLDGYQENARLPAAAAFNFLMAAGTMTGGWLLAKSALIAQGKLAEDESFYSAKITTARFYAEQILPRTESYIKAAQAGSDTMMAMSDEQF